MATMARKTLCALLACVVPLVGCSFTPPWQRPPAPLQLAWSTPVPANAATPRAAWWQSFANPELDRLMAEALVANLPLEAALARVDQARATLAATGAAQGPAVDASGSLARSTSQTNSRETVSSTGKAQLSIGYELDLWGKLAAQSSAASAKLDASRFDVAAQRLTVQSELARAYITAVGAGARLALARRNLEMTRRILDLLTLRQNEGLESALEVAQQRTTVAGVEAQLPTLQAQRSAAEHALALLLGRAPDALQVEATSLSTLSLPRLAADTPASLLERRPDIAGAEANLRAANADIGAAKAALYPTLDLSAALSVSLPLDGGGLTTGNSLAAALAAPLFDGGRLRAQVDSAQARKQELVATYRHTVLSALGEVEDALVSINSYDRRYVWLTEAADASARALALAEARYQAGAIDFLTVLDAQRSQLSAQDALVQGQIDRLTGAVDLVRALGGGWDTP
jgi:outer membrane protein, multidrug efflux system